MREQEQKHSGKTEKSVASLLNQQQEPELKGDSSMVTILPIDVDERLVREGLQYAVAERIASKMRIADELVRQLRGGNLVGREEWVSAFAAIAAEYAGTLPILDYAESLDDTDYTEEGGDGAAT